VWRTTAIPTANTLSATLVNSPGHGTLTFRANGSFTTAQEELQERTASFSYRASDGSLTSNLAVVTINVVMAKRMRRSHSQDSASPLGLQSAPRS